MTIYSVYQTLIVMRLDIGRFPTSDEGLVCLTDVTCNIDNWDGPYSNKTTLVDAWNNHLINIGE